MGPIAESRRSGACHLPRYHFNVFDGMISLDQVGTELSDVYAAQREALSLAVGLLDEAQKSPGSCREWRMEVTDAAGEPLFRFDFKIPGSAELASRQ